MPRDDVLIPGPEVQLPGHQGITLSLITQPLNTSMSNVERTVTTVQSVLQYWNIRSAEMPTKIIPLSRAAFFYYIKGDIRRNNTSGYYKEITTRQGIL